MIMKGFSKKIIRIFFAITLVVTIMGLSTKTAFAAYDLSSKNADGLYTVTFTYDPSTYEGDDQVTAVGFSGSFMFYQSNLTGNTDKTGMLDNTVTYMPYQYKAGMSLIGANFLENMIYDESSKLYKLEMQLPAGFYCYGFVINPVLGEASTENPTLNVATREGSVTITSGTNIADPNNKALVNPNVKPAFEFSVCYVGAGDEVRQNPISDTSKQGTVSYQPYIDVNGDTQYLGIYLPAGYDENASEPYKVVYASHGMSGDETNWFAMIGINNIMDNLIAEGKTEKAIVVTMNNSVYQWKFDTIKENVINNIIPYMEKNYNVSSEAKDRAFCGLSMGSYTTLYMYMNATSYFDYIGAFSGGYPVGDGFDLSNTKELSDVSLLIGCGEEDFAYVVDAIAVPPFMKELDKAGIPYSSYFVTGQHDMYTWGQMYTYFADNVLWSKSELKEEVGQISDTDKDGISTDLDTKDDSTASNINEIPKTGDYSPIYIITLLVLMSTCLFASLRVRKKAVK